MQLNTARIRQPVRLNACGNGKLPMDVYCQNINSQVQGEENGVALDGQQQQGGQDHKDKKDGGHDKDW